MLFQINVQKFRTPPQTVTFQMDGLNVCQKVGMLQIAKVTLQVFSNGFLLIKALWQELWGGLFRLVYFCILLYDQMHWAFLRKSKKYVTNTDRNNLADLQK